MSSRNDELWRWRRYHTESHMMLDSSEYTTKSYSCSGVWHFTQKFEAGFLQTGVTAQYWENCIKLKLVAE